MGGDAGTGTGGLGGSNVLTQLVSLLLAEKAGLGLTADDTLLAELERGVRSAATNAKTPAAGGDWESGTDIESIGSEIDKA